MKGKFLILSFMLLIGSNVFAQQDTPSDDPAVFNETDENNTDNRNSGQYKKNDNDDVVKNSDNAQVNTKKAEDNPVYLSPGIAPSFLKPFKDTPSFSGINVSISWVTGTFSQVNNSNGRFIDVYSEVGFYRQYHSGLNERTFFKYMMGCNLSFEKSIYGGRSFLIPYFGIKGGGIYFDDKSTGVVIEPLLGVILYRSSLVNISYNANYFINTAFLATMSGVDHSLSVNVSF